LKTNRHIVLYLVTSIWDITVCWPVVLLVWMFWGTDLRWTAPPRGQSRRLGYGLWCDLKPTSWPARTWYRERRDGKFHMVESGADQVRFGTWETWGGTTLGHGGWFGPGWRANGQWSSLEEHENTHVKQFEAVMLRSLLVGAMVAVTGAWTLGLAIWWLGYIMMLVGAYTSAWLRGEQFYRRSYYEEAAYDRQELYEQGRQ